MSDQTSASSPDIVDLLRAIDEEKMYQEPATTRDICRRAADMIEGFRRETFAQLENAIFSKESVRAEGYTAFGCGTSVGDVPPYTSQDCHDEWVAGWRDAEALGRKPSLTLVPKETA